MKLINNEHQFSHKVVENTKLFDYLKSHLVLSFRQTNSLIKTNDLFVNDEIVTKNRNICEGDVISIHFKDEQNEYEAENIPLDILYESDDLLIINKPPHILVHPTKNFSCHTIANAVSFYYTQINLKRKIRFINRLDRDTSGILMIAKNAFCHSFLSKQFERNQTTKKYLTIVSGCLKQKIGVIETNIKKSDDDIKYEVNDEGKASITLYEVLYEYNQYSLIECELKTGRTHQIRVSLASIGVHILGDSLYAKDCTLISRLALHAHYLAFIEPRTFIKKEIICELPQDMKILLY